MLPLKVQNGSGRKSNKRILQILKVSRTGASLSDAAKCHTQNKVAR